MELKTIQFIQTTPEHLQEAIVSGIRVEIDSLRREFQPKQPIQYLSRSDVKAMLGVDLSTIHNWTKRGVSGKQDSPDFRNLVSPG